MKGLRAQEQSQHDGPQVVLTRALHDALDLAGFFFIPASVILSYALVTHRDMAGFLLGFTAGPFWIGSFVGALFLIRACRSFRKHPPGSPPARARRRSNRGKLFVVLMVALIISGAAVNSLSHLHASQSTPGVPVSAGIACGGFFGMAMGVALYAVWLHRKERQAHGAILVAVSVGHAAFYVLDAKEDLE
jgi:hypothetical protein